MSDTTEPDTCPARTLDAGYEVTCGREVGHPSVHLGKTISESGTALYQWTDAQSISDDDNGPVEPLPLWYSALPIGDDVQIAFREHPIVDHLHGVLTGLVLDDHEQPGALRVTTVVEGVELHTLVPWSNVAGLAWYGDDQ